MDQSFGLSGGVSSLDQPTADKCIVRSSFVRFDADQPLETLAQGLGSDPLATVILFVTPSADAADLIAQAKSRFAPATVVGCTTAGELSRGGYSEQEIVAIGLPYDFFRTRTILLPDLDVFQAQDVIDTMIRNRKDMILEHPYWDHEFTFLMVDGLSTKEDHLTSELAIGLGPVPLFGASAGDGMEFSDTFVLHDGEALSNAAVLLQVRTRCPIRVFKTDHLVPTEQRMVVTGADPARRLVHEINAEPAAREYARILGKDPEQLTAFTFAAHPVVVQIGGQHHVRAIQRVADNGDLVFFSAIDEGLVLTLAEPQNMVRHLEHELTALSEKGRPDIILACDCVLRRMEAQQKQMTGALSSILMRNRVVGLSTYGEQINSMHVNQTLTGVAIYPPEE